MILVPEYALCGFAGQVLFDRLAADAPTYRLDLWVASVMLAVIFQVFVVHAEFFGYWPLTGRAPAQDSRRAILSPSRFCARRSAAQTIGPGLT